MKGLARRKGESKKGRAESEGLENGGEKYLVGMKIYLW